MKILLYCQHLLGMGHYVRSLALAGGLKDHQVYFINGGVPIPQISIPENTELVQLPSIQSDENFTRLITNATSDILKTRRDTLLNLYQQIKPDILLIELFPFGRRKFEFELIPLLETNLNNPHRARVICSLRDILVTKSNQTKYEARVCKQVARYFDAILVHADPEIITLDESFSRVADLHAKIYYTGYVVPQNGHEFSPSDKDPNVTKITVSAGGGRVGFPLLKTAIEAKSLLMAENIPVSMTLITGPFLPEQEKMQLQTLAKKDSDIKIIRFVPDLCAWLKSSQVSVSMAGYNTCLDVLQARVPAVLVPFTGGGNDEQRRRAGALAARGLARLLLPENLTPETLAQAIQETVKIQPPEFAIDLAGAQNSAKIINSFIFNPGQPADLGDGFKVRKNSHEI